MNIRNVTLTLFCVIAGGRWPAFALADGATITGAVVDPLGASIAGAAVVLVRDGDEAGRATTDERGSFRFTDVPPGRYQVRVRAPGFETRTTDAVFVGPGARSTVDVSLAIGPLQQDVVVTASASALPQSQLGAAVTVVGGDTLQALAKADVLESIRLVPGVQVVQTGQRGGTTSVFVRGGNANFNKVLIDGVPVDDIGGAFEFATLGYPALPRAVRGGLSVTLGGDTARHP
jgi:vitamin B12 transporter